MDKQTEVSNLITATNALTHPKLADEIDVEVDVLETLLSDLEAETG